jgi:hypothetical protein
MLLQNCLQMQKFWGILDKEMASHQQINNILMLRRIRI